MTVGQMDSDSWKIVTVTVGQMDSDMQLEDSDSDSWTGG